MKIRSFLISMLLIMSACGSNDADEKIVLPTDLTFTVEQSQATKGQVEVVASAKNVNFYTVYFGESATEAPVKVNDGKASHTYATSGTYTIRIQAHVTATDFIEQEKTVTIDLTSSNSGGINIPSTGFSTPETYSGMTLVWRDEFNGPSINSSDWTFETGAGGWGNNELQFYRAENAAIQDGNLVITAKKESFQGSDYTSTRMITKNKKSFQYGRIDIRAVLPKGQGIWPALWMLGANIDAQPWPKCGEIDIMEMIGGSGKEKTVYGTGHWDNAGQQADAGGNYSLTGKVFSDEFHVFSIVWTASSIIWYVDNVQYYVLSITPAGLSEFKNQFFFIFNIAVGGNWPQDPDGTTIFPQHMIVDYVRVFQQ
jgi:beta-glucanase (GH16 family)